MLLHLRRATRLAGVNLNMDVRVRTRIEVFVEPPGSLLKNSTAAQSPGCDFKAAAQVVVLRAVRSLALHLARLKNATMTFFNRLLGDVATVRCGGLLGPSNVAKARVSYTEVHT